jgi:hypothetical protein
MRGEALHDRTLEHAEQNGSTVGYWTRSQNVPSNRYVLTAGHCLENDDNEPNTEALIAARGRVPRFLRVDNGPELTSRAPRAVIGRARRDTVQLCPEWRGHTLLTEAEPSEVETPRAHCGDRGIS